MPKCYCNRVICNFIEIALRHWCFPVDLLHIFQTPFPRNNSGWLLLTTASLCFITERICEIIRAEQVRQMSAEAYLEPGKHRQKFPPWVFDSVLDRLLKSVFTVFSFNMFVTF